MTIPNALPRLTAASFQKRMTSGRTGALLMQCVGEEGDESRLVSMVVKTGGNAQILGGVRALLSEALGAQLALYFGLKCPEPAVVAIPQIIANSVRDVDVRLELSQSVGNNFGTLYLPGLELFRQLSDRDRAMAGNIFAFDLLTENGDRQIHNPNLYLSKAGLVVLDHEFCFRWDDRLFPGRLSADRRRWLATTHVLYRFLRETDVDFQPFLSKLEELSDSLIGSILGDMPTEWHGAAAAGIARYLGETRDDIRSFKRTLMEAIV